MELRASYVRVGLLVVGGIVLALAVIWFLSGSQIRQGTEFETYFTESVQGLQVGSNVQYRGVTLGRVTQVGLVSAEYGDAAKAAAEAKEVAYRMVYVRYVVDISKVGPFRDIPEAIRLGLRARLGSQFITGLAYIDLTFVDPETYPVLPVPWTPKEHYVPSIPSAFQQVQNAGQQVLAKLDKVDLAKLVTSLTDLSDKLQTELDSGDLHATLAAAQTLLSTTNQQVKQADLPGLTANLGKTSDALRAIAQNPDLAKLLANGAIATDRLAALTGRMSSLISSLEATVRQAQSGAVNLQSGLDPILRNLSATSQSLRGLTESLRQYPGQVLAAPPPPPTRLPR
jgi:ABC-type transporter Mla subunit MlaD